MSRPITSKAINMIKDMEKNSEHEEDASVAPNLKMRDGIILMPQPSNDPNDPLNWSWFRKHAAMFTISYLALVCYVAVTTLVTGTVPLAESLHVSKSTAVYLGNTPVALYGVAPWLWSPLSHFIGRRSVLLICNVIAMVGAIVVATSKTYAACIVGRVILGAGGSAFWTLGPASIGDMVFFLPETIYIREARPDSASTTTQDQSFVTTPGESTLWARYGIHIPKRREEKQHSFFFIATRPFVLFKFPAVILSAFWFGIAYMMHVGITAEIPLVFEEQYNFSVLDVGLTGFSGLIGALIGEAYAGPSLDYIAKHKMKHGREWRPEYRLQAVWPSLVAVPAGLIMFGTSLQFGHAWITPLVGQAIYIFGIEVGTTVIQTYILECYPRQGAEANLVFNLIRNIFSYTGPFFVQPMIARLGITSPFALFAALTVFFFPFTMGVLMWRGKEIRDKGGDPGWSRD
ncbi:uncharacterized protein PFLUO_LOCUS6436 [Penicillium psychrofluorescens]|uniref:uncharacterized protein n=1 Tax=Penicillium psychrofluorescens TaxID=3158075 RepID=UPI003CCE0DA6